MVAVPISCRARGSCGSAACRGAAAAAGAGRTCPRGTDGARHRLRCGKHLVKIKQRGSTLEPEIKRLQLISEEECVGQTTCWGFEPTVRRSAGTFSLTSIPAPGGPGKTFCGLLLLAPSHPTLLRCSEGRSSPLISRKLLMLFLSHVFI